MESHDSRRSSVSAADSGISVSSSVQNVDRRYACYWLDSCQGDHEIDRCRVRKAQLRGKLGIYYSPNTMYKRFSRDELSNASLEHNPTGCTMINLLIYKYEDDQIWLLFTERLLKCHDTQSDELGLFLSLVSSNPFVKGERPESIARRAMGTITNRSELKEGLRSQLRRFLFVNAIAAYPLFLTTENVQFLSESTPPDTDIESLHWFPLSTVLGQIPQTDHYLKAPATRNELAQVRENLYPQVTLIGDNGVFHQMWPATAGVLWSIRNHVKLEEFFPV